MNGKPNSSMFNEFWDELALLVEEVNTAVDEQRYGNVLHMPIAISISDLRQKVLERLQLKHEEGNQFPEIPSIEWIRLQFSSRNPYCSITLRQTGKLNVKFAVQRRQLRKSHIDSKDVMMLLKYAKSFAVKFSEHVILVSIDDKPVGEPQAPVSTGVRGHHQSLVPT